MRVEGRRCRILAISGSVRSASTNTALLEAARLLAPPGVTITRYAGLAALPAFDPDLDDGVAPVPGPAAALRTAVGSSDALVFACREYAHGIPGAFKNALDWLVGGPEFPGKPIALFQATTRGAHVRASLEEVLTTMSGRVVPEACLALPLVGKVLTADDLADDAVIARDLRACLARLVDACGGQPAAAARPIPV